MPARSYVTLNDRKVDPSKVLSKSMVSAASTPLQHF